MKKLIVLAAALFFGKTSLWGIDKPIYLQSSGIPSRVVAGDLNNDGNQDIAWITYNTSLLYTMLGDGNGGFNTPRTVAVPATSVNSLAMGDFNEDTKLDIVVAARSTPNAVTLYFGSGDGSMTFNQSLYDFQPVYDIVAADFNPTGNIFFGNSDLDVAFSLSDFDVIVYRIGDGNGNFGSLQGVSSGGDQPWYMDARILPPFFIFDFNLRPANLIVGNRGSGNIGIILSNSDPNTPLQAPVSIGAGLFTGVAWGTFNNDRVLDIAATKAGGGVQVFYGTDFTGVNYDPPVDLTSNAFTYFDVCDGDFNGDGYVDLAAASSNFLPGSQGVVTFFLNNGSNSFSAGLDDTTKVPFFSCETADINGNGRPDLLLGALGRDSTTIYSLRAPLLNPDLSALGNPAAGQTFNLNGTATDSSSVTSIKFLHRQMGKTDFDTLNFSLGAAGTKQSTFSLALSPTVMTNRGLEYVIIASDGFITERRPAGGSFYRMRTSVNQNAPPTADGAYQLVSFPFAVNPPSAASQIVDNFSLTDPKVARLFWWDPTKKDSTLTGYTEFPGTPDFIPGRSMFLATNGSQNYNGVGLSTLADTLGSNPDYVQLPIDSGWNMIATPYGYPVAFDTLSVLFPNNVRYDCPYDLDSCVGNWTDLNVRAYTGTGYAAKKVLEPWRGYYVFSKHPGQIYLLFPKFERNIPNPSLKPANEHEVNWPTDWKIAITAKSGDLLTPETVLGAAGAASKLQDKLDLAIPPAMPGEFRVAFQKGKEFGLAGDYLSDIRPTLAESETWNFTVQPGGTRAIELGFEGLAEVPADYDVILTDREGRVKQNLRTEPLYRLIASQDRHFELAVTPKTTGEAALLPTKYELHQNLPNPFNPQTLIKYDLPEAANVRLEVFNILGQKVTTLVDRYEAAGPKSALWDGTDAKGAKVSSGIYLYKIIAGDYSATKKMMLVK